MDDKSDSKKPQETPVSENLDRQTPPSRKDSLPPFPIQNAAQPKIPATNPAQDPPVPQQEPSLTQTSTAQSNQGEKTNLNIKPPNFSGGFSLAKILAVFLIVVFLMTSFGSLTLAYTNYKFITPPKIVQRAIDRFILETPLPKTTRLILRRTERKMADLKSAVLETQLEFVAESKDFPVSSAKITVKGPADFQTQKYSKTQLEISGEVAMEGIKISAAGEIRQIEDNLYFQLTEVPGGALLPLDEVKNQWFVLSVDKLNKEKRTQEDELQIQKLKEVLEDFVETTYEWTTLEDDSDENVYTLK